MQVQTIIVKWLTVTRNTVWTTRLIVSPVPLPPGPLAHGYYKASSSAAQAGQAGPAENHTDIESNMSSPAMTVSLPVMTVRSTFMEDFFLPGQLGQPVRRLSPTSESVCLSVTWRHLPAAVKDRLVGPHAVCTTYWLQVHCTLNDAVPCLLSGWMTSICT